LFFAPAAHKVDELRDALSLLTGMQHALTFEIRTNVKCDLFENHVDLIVYGEIQTSKGWMRSNRIRSTPPSKLSGPSVSLGLPVISTLKQQPLSLGQL